MKRDNVIASTHAMPMRAGRLLALLLAVVCMLSNLTACNMSNLPRNMNLKAFDPHRADFTCKHEADVNRLTTAQAEALFQQGMTVTSYELLPDQRDHAMAAALWQQAAAQGHWKAANGAAAYQLAMTLKNFDKYHVRALNIYHEGGKLGSEECAGALFSSFDLTVPLTGNTIDTARSSRYGELARALELNPDLRFPNLDKVLPLPPAKLPMWDGQRETLVDAAKALVLLPAVTPTPGAQSSGRAHTPQGHVLREPPRPVVVEAQSPVPYSGYQLLALEHKLVATRGSFLNVYEAMHLIDPNAAAPAGSGENKSPSAVQFLLIELAQLASCSQSDGAIDEYAATEILRRSGPIERLIMLPSVFARARNRLVKQHPDPAQTGSESAPYSSSRALASLRQSR